MSAGHQWGSYSALLLPDQQCTGCGDGCYTRGHYVSLSYAQLSGLSIGSLLDSNSEKLLQEKYHDALNIKHRVEADLLLSTIQQFVQMESSYIGFNRYLDFNILDTLTSITGRTEEVMELMADLVRADIADRTFGKLTVYKEAYENYTHPGVTSMTDSLEAAVQKARQFELVLVAWSSSAPDLSYDRVWADRALSEMIALLTNCEQTLLLVHQAKVFQLYEQLDTPYDVDETLLATHLEWDEETRLSCSDSTNTLLGSAFGNSSRSGMMLNGTEQNGMEFARTVSENFKNYN